MFSRNTMSLLGLLVAAMLGLALATPAQADSATWNGTTDALWATTTNWAGPPAAVPGTGNTATFDNAGNANTTLDLGTGVTINTILFDTAGAAAYIIGSGAVGSQTLTLDNGGAITINSTVANNQTINAAVVLGNDGTAQPFYGHFGRRHPARRHLLRRRLSHRRLLELGRWRRGRRLQPLRDRTEPHLHRAGESRRVEPDHYPHRLRHLQRGLGCQR